jgi:hypothetical protein
MVSTTDPSIGPPATLAGAARTVASNRIAAGARMRARTLDDVMVDLPGPREGRPAL